MNYDSLTELYQIQYRHYRDDLAAYTRLAMDYGGPVLELGAGTGRVSTAIAKRGIEVVALELSEAMRQVGQAATQGLPVHWLVGDMRALQLQQRFPLIIAPFNAFMHLYTLDDQDQTLSGVVQHLAPGGRVAFDLYNPALIGPPGVLQHEGSYEGLEVFVRQEHYPEAQMLITHHYLDSIDAQGQLKRQIRTLEQRYFTRFEVERWLRAHGLACRVSGGFAGQPFGPEAACMFFVAWKEQP